MVHLDLNTFVLLSMVVEVFILLSILILQLNMILNQLKKHTHVHKFLETERYKNLLSIIFYYTSYFKTNHMANYIVMKKKLNDDEISKLCTEFLRNFKNQYNGPVIKQVITEVFGSEEAFDLYMIEEFNKMMFDLCEKKVISVE